MVRENRLVLSYSDNSTYCIRRRRRHHLFSSLDDTRLPLERYRVSVYNGSSQNFFSFPSPSFRVFLSRDLFQTHTRVTNRRSSGSIRIYSGGKQRDRPPPHQADAERASSTSRSGVQSSIEKNCFDKRMHVISVEFFLSLCFCFVSRQSPPS